MIELLSNEEKDMIDYYRRIYAPSELASYVGDNWASVDKILEPWEKVKQNHLYQLLGNQLIVSKAIQYAKTADDITDQMGKMIIGSAYCRENRREHSGKQFVQAFYNLVDRLAKEYDKTVSWMTLATGYLSPYSLAINNYVNQPEFPMPNGKMLKANGAKPMRVLAKIAKAYDLPGFEEFRIAHSLILNQSKFVGNMKLSIHPLDYMTMSDNDCGWDSCMQWISEGSYRRGTVEMMNSPTVVVAYMDANEPFDIGNGQKWDNKKWRQLFVVDKTCIVAVKAYPYANDELTKIAMDWILQLAKDNLHWEYAEPRFVDPDSSTALHFEGLVGSSFAPDGNVRICLDCGAMYNDLGTLEEHYVAPIADLTEEDLPFDYERRCLILPYSGPSECMMCGSIVTDFDDESCLLCDQCMHFVYCEYCDERIGPNDGVSIDGRIICDSCYENQTATCSYCGAEHLTENMVGVKILPRLSREYMRKAAQDWKQRNSWSKGTCIPEDPDNADYNFDVYGESYWLCKDPDCINSWKENSLKEGADWHRFNIGWSDSHYVFLDELEEEALDDAISAFYFRDNWKNLEERNEAYIEWFKMRGRDVYPIEDLSQSEEDF